MSAPVVAIVEDNEKNRKIMRRLLNSHGYTTIEATDGPAGLEMVIAQRPALVLMDVQLPEMDGYAVTRALKADEQTRGIPIIAVTSFAMAGEQDRARQAGCDAYISKPFNIDELVDAVRQFVPLDD